MRMQSKPIIRCEEEHLPGQVRSRVDQLLKIYALDVKTEHMRLCIH
jgi:hypothetical protein